MVESFLFLCGSVVPHEVLVGPENAGGLHGSAAFRTQDALGHDSARHVEGPAIVADPVIVGNLVDAITSLVHWNITSSTEDNLVLVFVVAIVADSALGILLHDKPALVGTEGVVALDIETVGALRIGVVATLCELL